MAECSVPGGNVGAGKRPYRKPVVESEQIFETMAAVCNKCQGTNPAFPTTYRYTGGMCQNLKKGGAS